MDRKLHILYAETNHIIAREISKALIAKGYDVYTVYSGHQAWLAFQQAQPDVVLLEYQMPGLNGIEVFLLIQQLNPAIPVLIFSSFVDCCAASLRIGCSDFIHKDSNVEEICARIDIAWKRHFTPIQIFTTIPKIYQLSDISCYNSVNFVLMIAGQQIFLKGMLADLLTILYQNQNIYINQNILCKRLWNNDDISKIHLLRDYISRLRQILQADPTLKILSAYSKGYCLKTSN